MTKQRNCPICGTSNTYTYYTEEYFGSFGAVEEYYYCNKCGYNFEKCYSPTHESIDLLDGWDFELLKQAWKGKRSENGGIENENIL